MSTAHLPARITALREAAGLTRNALAVMSGVDAAYLMRLERGDVTDPSFGTVARLADALGVPLDDFRATAPQPKRIRKKSGIDH